MPQVTLNIPDSAKAPLLAIWPNDKEYEDDGTTLKYTDWKWLEVKAKRHYNEIKQNGEDVLAKDAVIRTEAIT